MKLASFCVLALNLLLPLAHGSIEGIGDLFNGILHPLRSPAHILVLVGLGLFAGQRYRFKSAVVAFLVAAALGLGFTQVPGVGEMPVGSPCVLSAILGLLVALRRPVPPPVVAAFFGVSGFLLGWDSAPDPSPIWVSAKILLGVWVGLAVILLNFANYAAMCPRKAWVKIAFRVLGSWTTAISALYLALTLRR